VHQMAGVVLASLTEQGHKAVRPPSLVKAYDYTSREAAAGAAGPDSIVPNRVIADAGRPLLRTLLQAPLCYSNGGVQHGTLKALGSWCVDKRTDLRLHFAKTGTSVGTDINATVDTWIAGGLQFTNGAAYSYVVMIGTGNPRQPWARSLHAAQIGVPLLETLLAELKEHAKKHGVPVAAQTRPLVATTPAIRKPEPSWRERVFQTN
jgi:penicillin-binding protein 1A